MSVDEYKQKAAAKLEDQKAAIDAAKAKLGDLAGDARTAAEEQLGKLEESYDAATAKMAELADAGEEAWSGFADSVGQTWDGVTDRIKNLFA